MVPLIRSFDGERVFQTLFSMWADQPHTVLLQGGWDVSGLGRYSILGFDPCAVIKAKGHRVWIQDHRGRKVLTGDPFNYVARWYEPIRRQPLRSDVSIPFQGGAMGYFGYDLAARSPNDGDDLGLPDLYLPVFDVFAVYDHVQSKTLLWSTEMVDSSAAPSHDSATRLDEVLKQVDRKITQTPAWRGDQKELAHLADFTPGDLKAEELMKEQHSSFRKDSYLKAVRYVQDAIRRGEVFQVNLAQRFSVPFAGSPVSLFERVRHVNPAPLGAYIHGGRWQIVSISPERGFRFDGKTVETRPIKGTRPRGTTKAKDDALRQQLLDSEKDRAEHIMIVDQERDDLSRFCRVGTVTVPDLMVCEGHPSVWHLVSTVSGEVHDPTQIIKYLKSFFPSGSITGAPKTRVMEIIATLEPVKRGVYTGAIGYLGVGGQIDLNIAIRTITIAGEKAHFHVGGGIVVDSDPEDEYQETIDKGRALAHALSVVSGRKS